MLSDPTPPAVVRRATLALAALVLATGAAVAPKVRTDRTGPSVPRAGRRFPRSMIRAGSGTRSTASSWPGSRSSASRRRPRPTGRPCSAA